MVNGPAMMSSTTSAHSVKRMSYYTGCELKIKIPTDRAKDEDAIRNALLEKLPGIGIEFISSPDVRRPSVAQAFVPHNHPMAGMGRQDFGNLLLKAVAGEALLGIAGD